LEETKPVVVIETPIEEEVIEELIEEDLDATS